MSNLKQSVPLINSIFHSKRFQIHKPFSTTTQLKRQFKRQQNPEWEWGYDENNGPATWHKVFPCANGLYQSPIDLRFENSALDRELSNSVLTWRYHRHDSKVAENDGRTLRVWTDGTSSKVIGGPLRGDYRLAQFHFHWGDSSHHGSEHTLEGKAFPGEVHLVHYNEAYASFDAAWEQPAGLCVLGAFIQVGEEHQGMKGLFDVLLSHLKCRGSSFDLAAIDGVDPSSLLPSATSTLEGFVSSPPFFTYRGSLTQPPLYESVHWINFLEPIFFSEAQMKMLRQLSSTKEEDGPKLVNNYRPCCPLDHINLTRNFRLKELSKFMR